MLQSYVTTGGRSNEQVPLILAFLTPEAIALTLEF